MPQPQGTVIVAQPDGTAVVVSSHGNPPLAAIHHRAWRCAQAPENRCAVWHWARLTEAC